jgi:hypothetical protein
MNTDQARHLVTLHDNADRAIANLRNANAMATDDPRSTELLEEAGDAYAESLVALFSEQVPIRTAHSGGEVIPSAPPADDGDPPPLEAPPVDTPPAQPTGAAAGAEDPAPAGGQVQPEADRGTPAEGREPVEVPEFAAGKAAWIVVDGAGAGYIVDGVEGVIEGNVAVCLTTEGSFRGEDYPSGATISVPTDALTLNRPDNAPSVDVRAAEASGQGNTPASA